jgi:protein-S-isoprenylcysteine O-methyltransferase Ste14
MTLVYIALLSGAAGTVAWPQAWAYLAVLCTILGVYVAIVARVHPDLIAERTRPPADAKAWDKPIAILVAVVGPVALILLAGLEHRYRAVPASGFSATALAGLVMAGAGGALANWAVYANRFFSALVRIQTDRGHRVVDTGPYAIVRHPGYAGSLVANVGAAAALESWAAFAVVCAITVVMIVRTTLEDRTLRDELEGYEAYAERVRFRLVPGVW